MPRLKDETLSIRTSSEIKELLRMAAEGERRSVASMVEILVLEYARAHDLTLLSRRAVPANTAIKHSGAEPNSAIEKNP